MKRVLVVIIIILLLGAGGFFGYKKYQTKQKKPQYKTETVSRGSIIAQVIASGTVNPVTLVQVGSQVSGTIIKLSADYNSVVRRGQVIAQIDPSLFKARVDLAEADLRNAQAGLEREKASLADSLRNLNRYKALYKDQLISQMELDQAQTKHDVSQANRKGLQAQIEQAQANLLTAKTNLNYATIRSPVNGIVVARNVDVGQTVAASLQAPTLFTIAQDLKEMEVHTNVDEADIGKLHLGQSATFTVDAFPLDTFSAEVSQIRSAPTTVQNVVTYDVVLRVNNPELKLKPGMTSNVTITIEKKEDVLMIPNSVLRFRMPPAKLAEMAKASNRKFTPIDPSRIPKNIRALWVPQEGENPRPVIIRTGSSDGKNTEITVLRGKLQEKDQVISEMLKNDKNPNSATPMRGMRF
ncbi:MAG: efflux RND transporter periplasmic adaptor subunit [Thermodesulfobacteriota bacterium]